VVTVDYLPPSAAPSRQDVDGMAGRVVLEFGTGWCGFCRGAEPRIAALLARYPQVKHVKVEDGPGRKLGRSFRVKLWPTLVFLHDGAIVRQLARPEDAELEEAFSTLARETTGPATG
jgi:thioredoxin 1